MRIGSSAVAVCAAVCLQAGIAAAQSRTLTLAEVLARAREQAPQIVSARLALEETRGRLLGASLRFQTNPEIDAGLGSRQGPATRFTDFDIGIGQTFEPGSRRSARIEGANAAIAQSRLRTSTRPRGSSCVPPPRAYYRALHATERIRLLAATQELAAGVHSVADRRFKAGDIAILDVNIARASLARVRAEREGAEAAKALALGELKQVLRLEEDIVVDGALCRWQRRGAERRPSGGISTARAPCTRGGSSGSGSGAASWASTFSKPDYGLGVRYSREEGDQIVFGGVKVTLPDLLQGPGAARRRRRAGGTPPCRARGRARPRAIGSAVRLRGVPPQAGRCPPARGRSHPRSRRERNAHDSQL